jgi:hypothetical protein
MELSQALQLVKDFETGTLPKESWTHVAHIIVGVSYCLNFPLPEAVRKIRANIKAYNERVGGLNTDHSGYHETITLFYMKTIAGYLVTTGFSTLTQELLSQLQHQPFLDKNYPLQFYSRECLMSPESRKKWMVPDIATPSAN